MITKSTDTLVVEGPVSSHHSRSPDELVRLRITVDATSGVITDVGEPQGSGDLVLDDEYVVLPGLIDAHVHAREDVSGKHNYKETFASAGAAAIHGGVTALAEMPNNPIPPVDDDSYRAKRELAQSTSDVDILLFAGIGPKTQPLSFPAPYKAYMGPSIGELFFKDDESLRQALSRYRGFRVAFHAESPTVLAAHTDRPTHAERRPPHAEVEAIETAIRFCGEFQIDCHICHLSTADGLEVIRAAQKRGARVSCEVTPQHLYYDQANTSVFENPDFLQCNPPIRNRLDRVALLEAFRQGTIDFLATDHAPHSLEENEGGISGMPNLDTFGPFLFWLRQQGVTWKTIRETCCENPARFLNAYRPELRGKIESGYLGSLTILRQRPLTVRRESLRTAAGWSPFRGVEFPGQVSHTIVRGQVYPAEDG